MTPVEDAAVCDLIDAWAVEHSISDGCAEMIRCGLAEELSHRPVPSPTALPWGDVLVAADTVLLSITDVIQSDPGGEDAARLCRGAAFEIACFMRNPAPELPWDVPDSALCLLLDRCSLLIQELGGAAGATEADVDAAYRLLSHRVTELWLAHHPLLDREIDPFEWEAHLDAQLGPYAMAAQRWTAPAGSGLVQHLATSAGGYASKMTAYAAIRAAPSPRHDRSLFPDGGRDKLSVMVELSLPRMRLGVVRRQ